MTTNVFGSNPPFDDADLIAPEGPTTAGPSNPPPSNYPPMGMPEQELRGMYAQNNPLGQPPPAPLTLEQLMMRINQLETLNNELNDKRLSLRPDHVPRIKAKRPEPFDGDTNKLESFLTATDTFFYLEPANFPTDKSKILDTTLNFKGNPAQWIQPYSEKFLTGNYRQGSDVHTLFASWDSFKEATRKMYGNSDIQARAIREIESIKMRSHDIQGYTSRFQQIRARANIEDSLALKRYYYNGLTDFIKHKLSEMEDTADLQDLIDKSTKINSRAYERYMEKKGITTHQMSNHSQSRAPRKDHQGDTIMYNARITTDRKSGNGRFKGKNDGKWDKKNKLRKEGKCFRCEKLGHLANECPDKLKNTPSRFGMMTTSKEALD
jgi:hypothetical protein